MPCMLCNPRRNLVSPSVLHYILLLTHSHLKRQVFHYTRKYVNHVFYVTAIIDSIVLQKRGGVVMLKNMVQVLNKP